MGRPKIELNAEEVEKLAGLNCSNQEIADFFGVCKRTIETRFCAAIKKGRGHVKTSLKRKQYMVAMDGNVTMLVWLGKQYLGQADKIESTVTHREYEVEIGGDRTTETEAETQHVH